jgi:hypothetical protein
MEKLPKYVSLVVDSASFAKYFNKTVKDIIKKHGISKFTADLLSSLSASVYNVNKQTSWPYAETVKIESIFSRAEKASNSKLFVEDKFSKNSPMHLRYANNVVRDVISSYLTSLETSALLQQEDDALNTMLSLRDLSFYFRLAVAIHQKKYSEALTVLENLNANITSKVSDEVVQFIKSSANESQVSSDENLE